MAIGHVSNILTVFKADTKQHKAAIKQLSGEEKKRSQQLLENMEKENAKLDKQIDRLGKMAKVAAVVTAGYVAMKASLDGYLERSQLLASGAGKHTDALRKSTNGLVSDMKLLKIESSLLNGTVRLTGKQMETATKFMLALRKEGHNFHEVQQEVTKAFIELNTEGLKKFGVNIKAASGEVGTLDAILVEAQKHIDNFGGDLNIEGDDAIRAAAALENMFDSLKADFGELASEIMPALVAGLRLIIDAGAKLYHLPSNTPLP